MFCAHVRVYGHACVWAACDDSLISIWLACLFFFFGGNFFFYGGNLGVLRGNFIRPCVCVRQRVCAYTCMGYVLMMVPSLHFIVGYPCGLAGLSFTFSYLVAVCCARVCVYVCVPIILAHSMVRWLGLLGFFKALCVVGTGTGEGGG